MYFNIYLYPYPMSAVTKSNITPYGWCMFLSNSEDVFTLK